MTTISKADIERFTEGDCYILARAINKLTGWDICTFHYGDEYEAGSLHAFVRTPDGRYLDVEGVADHQQFWDRWKPGCGAVIRAVERRVISREWGGASLGRHSYARAAQLAPSLVAEASA